jgi:hypothetical protein
MNWFQRHLNWTLVVAAIATFFLVFIISFFLGLFIPDISEAAVTILGWAISLIAMFVTVIWVLLQKGRSPLWVLMAFLPFGWILWFTIKNKNV